MSMFLAVERELFMQRCAALQVGLLVQNLVTFAVAYLIAFSAGWRMTLVVTASIPLMVIAGGVQASVMTGFTSKAQACLFWLLSWLCPDCFAHTRLACRRRILAQCFAPQSRELQGLPCWISPCMLGLAWFVAREWKGST